MPVIIEANYAKKVGLPAYSSHQFSVTLRTELTDLSQLEQVNAELYERLQAAVDSQIVQVGFVPGETSVPTTVIKTGSATTTPSAPVNGSVAGEDSQAWRCSDKQRDLILKIVDEHRLDKAEVEKLAQKRFGIGVRHLNKLQASSLIDELLETYSESNPPASRRSGGNSGNGSNGHYRRPAYGRAAR